MYIDTACKGVLSPPSNPESQWAMLRYRRSDLARDLARARRRHELEVHYQPKVSLISGMMRGVEALLRWRHPILGMLAPAMFLPLAVENDALMELTQWLMDEVCRQVSEWNEPGFETSIALKACPQQLHETEFLAGVMATTAYYGIPARAVELEVMEPLAHGADSVATLRELRSWGMKVAWDHCVNCGANPEWPGEVPVDILKIDRSVVQSIDHDEAMYQRAAELIGAAKAMGIATVGEGVENAEQARRLRELGCETAQGYYFAGPVPMHRLEYWMEGRV